MSWASWARIGVVTAGFGLLASAAADCQSAKTYTTCTGLCETVLPCNDTYDQCIAFCTATQDKCERVGHEAAFDNYVICTSDAGFSCTDAGEPVANAPCGPQQAELIQCDAPDGEVLTIPDGAYDAQAACTDAGSCLQCCNGLYPKGASEYSAAVRACTCGDAGKCASDCADAACETRPVQPTNSDKCDLCLSAALDEQTTDAGPCVVPVTLQCNSSIECALYMNCVTQPGCTN
jgi:hypothetical protein